MSNKSVLWGGLMGVTYWSIEVGTRSLIIRVWTGTGCQIPTLADVLFTLLPTDLNLLLLSATSEFICLVGSALVLVG